MSEKVFGHLNEVVKFVFASKATFVIVNVTTLNSEAV